MRVPKGCFFFSLTTRSIRCTIIPHFTRVVVRVKGGESRVKAHGHDGAIVRDGHRPHVVIVFIPVARLAAVDPNGARIATPRPEFVLHAQQATRMIGAAALLLEILSGSASALRCKSVVSMVGPPPPSLVVILNRDRARDQQTTARITSTDGKQSYASSTVVVRSLIDTTRQEYGEGGRQGTTLLMAASSLRGLFVRSLQLQRACRLAGTRAWFKPLNTSSRKKLTKKAREAAGSHPK